MMVVLDEEEIDLEVSKRTPYYAERPECVTVCEYFRKKQKALTVKDEDIYDYIRYKKAAVPERILNEFFEKNLLPREYRYFRNICDALEVEDEKVEEWKETEPYFNYLYWDEIRPDAPEKAYIGLVLKKNNENYTRKEIVEGTGLTSTMVGICEFCRKNMTYPIFLKFAIFYRKEPMELYREYIEDRTYYDAVHEIHKLIKDAREGLGISREEAADRLGVSSTKYVQLESGITRFSVSDIVGFAIYFGIPAETLKNLVNKANLRSYVDTFEKATEKGEQLPFGERWVTDISKIGKNYKYIAAKNKKIETHTFLTLMYLFFYSDKSTKYYAEINYYLNHLFTEGKLIEQYLDDKGYIGKSDFEYFDYLRKKTKRSSSSISSTLNHSTSMIIALETGNGVFSPGIIKDISDEVGVSPAILTEGYMDTSEAKRDSVDYMDIISTINAALIWNYERKTVKSSTFAKMIEIIADTRMSGRQKYVRIKELKLIE